MGMMKIPSLKYLALLVMLVSLASGQQTPDELFQKAKAGDQAAVKQLTALASTGNVVAQHKLGYLYSTGEGVPKDSVQAVNWYRKAAEQGYAPAQYNLGYLYTTGEGVPQDSVQAVDWYRKAAEQGMSEAQNNLGGMYEFGAGVPKDLVLSYLWFDLAAAQGDEDAKKWRDGLGPKMTPTQIAEAQAMARSIKIGRLPSTSTAPIHRTPMLKDSGVYRVPVLINNAITLDFIVDSGASDVSIPSDVVSTLIRAGTIKSTDFTGTQKYELADGSVVQSRIFRINSLKIGDIVVENVAASVADVAGDLLLGQSFLSHFKSWSVDNSTHSLIIQ
jgi:clan AA aspartic protease (TIGR02281 family)